MFSTMSNTMFNAIFKVFHPAYDTFARAHGGLCGVLFCLLFIESYSKFNTYLPQYFYCTVAGVFGDMGVTGENGSGFGALASFWAASFIGGVRAGTRPYSTYV